MKTEKNNQSDFYNLFKPRRKYNLVYQNFVFLGFISFILIYRNINNNLIPIKDMLFVGIISSFVLTILFFRFYHSEFSIIWGFIHNLTFGLIIVGLFVWSNDNLSFSPIEEEVYRIENVSMKNVYKRSSPMQIKPIITLNVKGQNRKIVFSEQSHKQIMKSRKLKLSLKKGYWGYWIIKDQKLLK